MGDKSKISWCDASWNPTTGCSKVSEGCRNCYAAQLAPRLAAMGQTHAYTDLPWTAPNAAENVRTHEDRLEMPLRWKRPRRIFVDSMSDLFHELVPDDFVVEVFAVMYLTPRHTYQVLTKRSGRMASLLSSPDFRYAVEYAAGRRMMRENSRGRLAPRPDADSSNVKAGVWPIPNVWLGTSVEDQRAADTRIPHLLRTPAAVRFLSCEPLIGPVDLRGLRARNGALIDALAGDARTPDGVIYAAAPGSIDWVIAGGESGPNHRALDHAWMRSLRDQCAAAGVPFWAKQDSGPRSEIELPEDLRVRQFPQTAGVRA